MSKLNSDSQENWKVIETKGILYYSEQGYAILFKISDNQGYDFVIEKDGKFRRINVKVAFNDKNKPNNWSISASGSRHWRRKRHSKFLDNYLVWLPHKEKFIEVEGTFLDGINSKSRRLPKKLG